MLGFASETVNWSLGTNTDIVMEVNEIRRAVRLDGKGQQVVQSHVSEASTPVAENVGLVPGLAMDLRSRSDFFSKIANQERARALIHSERPTLLIGTPKLIDFDTMQRCRAKPTVYCRI